MSSTERIGVLHMPSIALGPGAAREAGHHLKALGVSRAFVVTDRFLADSGLIDPVVEAVRAAGFETVEFAPFRSGALNVLAGLVPDSGALPAEHAPDRALGAGVSFPAEVA